MTKLKKIISTLGVFDGVHLGHRKIITKVVDLAKREKGTSLVLTFIEHPKKITSPGKHPLLLTIPEEKINQIKKIGVDKIEVIDFTPEFAKTEALDFVKKFLVNKYKIKGIVVGKNYFFGKDKKGNTDFLKKCGKEYGFKVYIVKPVIVNATIVSSTKIRETLVENRNIELVNKMLGRNYEITGIVIRGKGIGKKIGFPTANISVFNEAIPANGVYAVKIKIGNKKYKGMCNIGLNPTLYKRKKTSSTRTSAELSRTSLPAIEVNIFDFNRYIYGKKIRVEFLKRIRDEKKFSDIIELTNQLKTDKIKIKKFL